MALHLLKLCVGVDSIADLEAWHAKRWRKPPRHHVHVTRMVPRRIDELIDGGSLYWVIKGQIAARQALIDLRAVTKNGTPHCGIVYEPTLIATARRSHRPFQGWRYLNATDAPPDARQLKGGKGLPETLKAELAELGLL